MTPADVMLLVGLGIGFLLGIPAGIWLCEFAKSRGWK